MGSGSQWAAGEGELSLVGSKSCEGSEEGDPRCLRLCQDYWGFCVHLRWDYRKESMESKPVKGLLTCC